MRPAIVSMIKDEEDIIEYWLSYYYNKGIRDFYLCDHSSKDNTLCKITDFKNLHLNVRLFVDIEVDISHWQYRKINDLAKKAISDGCDWILPIDCDELFFINNRVQSIPNFLYDFDKYKILSFQWWHFRPSENDLKNESNPFLRIRTCDTTQSSSHEKIFVRYEEGMEICQGNHELHNKNDYKEFTLHLHNAFHAHFRYRSKEQFLNKILNFGIAYEEMKDEFVHEGNLQMLDVYRREGEEEALRYYEAYCHEVPLSISEVFKPDDFLY